MSALICLIVYLRALSCDFINWDDPSYIINNPGIRILDRQFISEALTTAYMGWWMPLTWISFAIDYHFWALDPFGYHLTNVLLHCANTGLVVLIADRLLSRCSGAVSREEMVKNTGYLHPGMLLLAGLLWALHPLRVESVAWVTERKDVLNGLFSLGAILCYLRYVRMKDVTLQKRKAICSYICSLVLLLFSLMSKPVSVVIPVMLLLIDWYPLGRFRMEKARVLILEKLPFVVLVVLISIATFYFATGNQILVSYVDLTVSKRFVLAGNSLFEYCRMSLFPVGIIHFYLLPWPFPVSYAVKAFLMAAFSCICVWNCRKNPWLPATWFAFILPLLPVLGFFQNGAQSHAARFTYLPGVAPSICAAAIVANVCGRAVKAGFRFPRALLAGLVATPLLVCSAITQRHLAAWKNPETLWSRAIAIRPVGRAYYLRADYFLQKGRFLEAADDLQMSIDLGKKTGFQELFNLHALRGDALSKLGRHLEAVQEFTEAISLYAYPNYFYHRGLALVALGKGQEAEADFIRAGTATGPIEWRSHL